MCSWRRKGADPSNRDADVPEETTVEDRRSADDGNFPPTTEVIATSVTENPRTTPKPIYDQEAEGLPEDVAPTQAVRPLEPEEPAEPAELAEPIDTVELAEPINAVEPVEPVEPHLENTWALDPTDGSAAETDHGSVEEQAPDGSDDQADVTAPGQHDQAVAEEQLVWFPKWPERLTIEIGEASSAGHIDMALISKPEDRPDTIIDFGREGSLIIRAASVRGLSHRFKRVTRQDHYAIRADSDARYVVLACADGVSSAARSDRAARIAAERGAEIIARQLEESEPGELPWEDVIRQVAQLIVGDAKKQLAARADDGAEPDGARIMGYSASTVLYAVIETEPKEDGLQRVWSVGVGDTSAWTLDAGRWSSLTPIKNAGAAVSTSAVTPLPHLPPAKDLVVHRADLAQGCALFLMTDGVGDPIGAGSGEVAEELARRWATPPDPYSFAAQVDFSRRSYDDDRTVIGIWVMHP